MMELCRKYLRYIGGFEDGDPGSQKIKPTASVFAELIL